MQNQIKHEFDCEKNTLCIYFIETCAAISL